MHTMHLLTGVAIQPNLELKTQPKQLLGSLPLVIALPGWAKMTSWVSYLALPFYKVISFSLKFDFLFQFRQNCSSFMRGFCFSLCIICIQLFLRFATKIALALNRGKSWLSSHKLYFICLQPFLQLKAEGSKHLDMTSHAFKNYFQKWLIPCHWHFNFFQLGKNFWSFTVGFLVLMCVTLFLLIETKTKLALHDMYPEISSNTWWLFMEWNLKFLFTWTNPFFMGYLANFEYFLVTYI